MAVINTLQVEIENQKYTVTGSNFHSMLSSVKDVEGRKWGEPLGKGKVWILPGTVSQVKEILAPLELLTNEDELLDKEVEAIAELQKYIRENEEAFAAESSHQFECAQKYSFKSKSRYKAAHLSDSGMLNHAIIYAKLPIEELTSPQIATLKAARRFMEGE